MWTYSMLTRGLNVICILNEYLQMGKYKRTLYGQDLAAASSLKENDNSTYSGANAILFSYVDNGIQEI